MNTPDDVIHIIQPSFVQSLFKSIKHSQYTIEADE